LQDHQPDSNPFYTSFSGLCPISECLSHLSLIVRSVSKTTPDKRDAYPCKQDSQEKDTRVEGRLDSERHKAYGETDYDDNDTHCH
jgi:hypothetical protein